MQKNNYIKHKYLCDLIRLFISANQDDKSFYYNKDYKVQRFLSNPKMKSLKKLNELFSTNSCKLDSLDYYNSVNPKKSYFLFC